MKSSIKKNKTITIRVAIEGDFFEIRNVKGKLKSKQKYVTLKSKYNVETKCVKVVVIQELIQHPIAKKTNMVRYD